MSPVLIHGNPHNRLREEKLLLDEMFQLRHSVFKERLCWDVTSVESRERDGYDDLDPVYLLCPGENNFVEGCWRLLPSTGPYMLKDIFSDLLDDHLPPCSSTVWEASRFAVRTGERNYRSLAGLGRMTRTMVVALHEFAIRNGIDKIIAVSELRFERLLIRTGADVHRYGEPRKIGNVTAVAGWLNINRESLHRVQTLAGLQDSVLDDEFSQETNSVALQT
ncbi:MAG: GNAT family N-acetyltransferase [Rhodospirillales bacterium]|nr:GNAT family N-acetyltransferase [Rhodospirillales bacterium]